MRWLLVAWGLLAALSGAQAQTNQRGLFDTAPSVAAFPGVISPRVGNQVPGFANMVVDMLYEDGVSRILTEAGQWASTNVAAYFAMGKTFAAGQGAALGPAMTLFVMATNNGSAADVVPVVGDCLVITAGGTCFGGNVIARNEAGVNGTSLKGFEIDVQPAVGTTVASSSLGLALNIYSIPISGSAIQLGQQGGGRWGNGLACAYVTGGCLVATSNMTGASLLDGTQGTYSNTAIVLGNGISHGISLAGASASQQARMYHDAGGYLNITQGPNGLVIRNQSGSTIQATFDPYGGLTMPAINVTAAAGLRMPFYTPATSATACVATQISIDASYMYVCTATNTWKRAALATW